MTLEVTTSYFNVLQARNLTEVANQAVNDLDAHLINVQNHYDAGVSTNLDVMNTELAMIQAKTNYIQALYNGNNSRAQLNKAMGVVQ